MQALVVGILIVKYGQKGWKGNDGAKALHNLSSINKGIEVICLLMQMVWKIFIKAMS